MIGLRKDGKLGGECLDVMRPHFPLHFLLRWQAAMNVAELLDTQVRKGLFMADAMVKVPDGRFEVSDPATLRSCLMLQGFM